MKSLFRDIWEILFPRLCAACNDKLRPWDNTLCITCLVSLPITHFHEDLDNPLAQVFWGRVRLEQAVAWFYFLQGSIYRHVMHLFKYQNQPRIGIDLGKAFGYQLKHSSVFIKPDVIIPVPLHKKKLRKRGYNQSERIALGLSQALNKPMIKDQLRRTHATDTQTNKSRFDRYLNVKGKFSVADPDQLVNKHILLIDDVVTTGATLEACAEELLKIEGVKVSVATLAWAKTVY